MRRSHFFDLCYDTYRHEVSETDRLYTRFPLAISANVLIGGAVGLLVKESYVDSFFTRVDVFLYYGSAFACIGLLVTAVIFLAGAILPRRYKRIAALRPLAEWRGEYARELEHADEGVSEADIERIIDHATIVELEKQLIKTTEVNKRVNGRRTWWFNRSLYFTTYSLIPLLTTGVMHIVVWMNDQNGS